MTTHELTDRLSSSLQSISNVLLSVSADDWQRPQENKWTIAQEFEHLRLSTQGTAFVLSPAARPRWYAHSGESRSFETIVDQYQTALAATPNLSNPTTSPSEESAWLTVEQQTANWNSVVQRLPGVMSGLADTDLDAYTVWKHPLLGPLTVREMIYFTIHHTDHHSASLQQKQTQVPA